MPQFGLGQPALEGPVLSPIPLLVDQQGEPLLEAQLTDPVALSGVALRAKGLGHALQVQDVQLLQGLLIQHGFSSPDGRTAPLGFSEGSK